MCKLLIENMTVKTERSLSPSSHSMSMVRITYIEWGEFSPLKKATPN